MKMRPPGIEPGASAWEAEILPLNHERSHEHHVCNLSTYFGMIYYSLNCHDPLAKS